MSKTNSEIRLQHLLDDASYLQEELEALKFVIESIPYREKLPEGYSILEMIALIDHKQQNIYRPIFEQVRGENPTHRTNINEDFSFKQEKVVSVNKFLNSVIRRRASLLKTLHAIDEDTWMEKIDDEGQILLDLLQSMIDNERTQLRKMAEHVIALNSGNHPIKGTH